MNVLIIEDEGAAARRLQKMMSELDDTFQVVDVLDSIKSSVNWLSSNPHPDLILMDIHLADGPCFSIFEEIETNSPIIFTTAYDEYALKAFQVNSIDYLLKPIKKDELKRALSKFKAQHADKSAVADNSTLLDALKDLTGKSRKRLTVKIGSRLKLVYLDTIAYAFTSDKITFVVTNDGKRYPVDFTLEKLEQALEPDNFFRINRQFIVGLHSIEEMYSYSKSRVKIKLKPATDMDTIVSVERSGRFKKWLEGIM